MNKKLFISISLLLSASVLSTSLCLAGDELNNNRKTTPLKKQEEQPPFPGSNLTKRLCEKIIKHTNPTMKDLAQFALVSKTWQSVVDADGLWQYVGSTFQADYPLACWQDGNGKKTYKTHFLKVRVNLCDSPDEILFYTLKFPELLEKSQNIYTESIEYLVIRCFAFGYYEDACLWAAKGSERAKNKIDENIIKTLQHDPILLQASYQLLIRQGHLEAARNKIYDFLQGRCASNIKLAQQLNELLIMKDDVNAIFQKYDNLCGFTTYKPEIFYEENLQEAPVFLKSMVARPTCSFFTLERYVRILAEGDAAFKKDPAAAINFIETRVKEEDLKALELQYNGYETGRYGYQKNSGMAEKLQKERLKKGDTWAIDKMLYGLLCGNELYKVNISSIPSEIENLIGRKETARIGIYLKAFLMYHGLYNFQKNKDGAKALIKKHQIGY